MIKYDNCLFCGQEIYSPLLDVYEKKKRNVIKIITSFIIEACGVTEENAKKFAIRLLEKIEENKIDDIFYEDDVNCENCKKLGEATCGNDIYSYTCFERR